MEDKYTEEQIDENLVGTFPASDPPGWTLGHDQEPQENSQKNADKKACNS